MRTYLKTKQLPPIDPNQENYVLNDPHIFLDEIMRQEAESEIIRLSMWIREGNPLTNFPCSNKEVMILEKDKLTNGMISWADIIITSTNKNRIALNDEARKLKGFPAREPQVGDRVISLANHWDFVGERLSPLTNGSIGTITKICKRQKYYPPRYISAKPIEVMYTDILMDSGELFEYVPIDYSSLVYNKKAITEPKKEIMLLNNKQLIDPPFEFAYGYAATCWKLQGSQAAKVLTVEEGFPYEPEEHQRWLYTAITRAEDKLVMISK